MSRFTPSLRSRLAFTSVAVLGAALLAFSLLLHATFSRALSRQFQDTLAAEVRALANLVEVTRDGGWEIESEALESLARGQRLTAFAVWTLEGTLIVSSSSGSALLGASRSPPSEAPVLDEQVLAQDHRALRYEARALSGGEDGRGVPVTVAVLQETEALDTVTTLLWGMLTFSGLVTLALAALVAVLATRRGLAPLGALASQLEEMDDTRLALRLPEHDLPGELRPVVRTLNRFLSRLEEAFERERQFSADVSHELRTPLAGLRGILEVCAMRTRPPAEYRHALGQCLAVVEQMHGLVENLLMLSRLDARQVVVESQEVWLRDFVDECFVPFASHAGTRGLRFENRVDPGRVVHLDREKLRIILTNLLSNATAYTEAGGTLRVASDDARGTLLEVEDSGPPLPPSTLERVFERFYRLDTSRTNTGEHRGIGLALVRALCLTLGMEVRAENRPGGWLAFVVGRGPLSRNSRPSPSPGD